MIAGDWKPDVVGDEAERRREAVAGRGRRDTDDGRRHEAERAALQALALDRSARRSGDIGGHASPCDRDCATVCAHDRRSAGQRQARVLRGLRLRGQVLQASTCSARRPVHFGRPTGAFEEADDRGRRIDLVRERAVARRARMRVMEVVPRLAHREHAERREVGAAGPCRSRAASRTCDRSSSHSTSRGAAASCGPRRPTAAR